MRSLCLAVVIAAATPATVLATPADQPATRPAMESTSATSLPAHDPVAPPDTPVLVSEPLDEAPTQVAPPPPPNLELPLGEHVLIKPQLQYRPRFLTHGARDFAGGSVYDAFSHRARLGATATAFRWFKAMIQLQDVRVWGEELNTFSDYQADGFDLHQAWLELGSPLGLSLRIGRQEFSLVNHRLIGTVGWADQARAFDGVLLEYRRGPMTLNGFYAKLGEKDVHLADPSTGGTLKGSQEGSDLALLHFHCTRVEWLRPSLSVIYDWTGVQNQNRVTLGTFLDGALKSGLNYSGEFYHQTGDQEVKGIKKTPGRSHQLYSRMIFERGALGGRIAGSFRSVDKRG